MQKTACFIVVGNELLSGKVTDTNTPFLIDQLRSLGVRLQCVFTIPDDVHIIAEHVGRARMLHDYVFTSGGIGPTHDDVTMEGIARAFEVSLHRNEWIAGQLMRYYGESAGDAVMRMADLPKGASILQSHDLHCAVVHVQNVYILPGIPGLFEKKFLAIREAFRSIPFITRNIYTLLGEEAIAEILAHAQEQCPEVQIGSYPRLDADGYRVLITLDGISHTRVEEATDLILQHLPPNRIVHIDDA